MATFNIRIEASVNAVSGNAPLIEILVGGLVVGSFSVTALTGSSTTLFEDSFDFTGNFPSSVSYRFASSSGDASDVVTLDSVRINGRELSGSDLTATILNRGQQAVQNMAATDHLFGYVAPSAGDLGTVTESGTGGDDDIVGNDDGTGDIIDAGGGNDVVALRDDDDAVLGGAGDDKLYGQGGNDILIGGSGNDRLFGNDGDDLLYGEGDNDTLRGGSGNDTLSGGTGNDFLVGDAGDDILFGGDGIDRLVGVSGSNRMYGDAGADMIFGGREDDIAYGGNDNDTIHGADGNDILYGDGGNDFITGGNGNDFISGGAGDDDIEGGQGIDTIEGGIGNDTINGDAGNDVIEGDDGNDIINGGDGDDDIEGGNGADTIDGGLGADQIDGGLGADILSGGAGNDVINGAGVTNETEPTFATASDLLSYGGAQDQGGSLAVIENGNGFILDGNLWKKVLVNYTVTANTVIEFDFKSTLEAEISGVGFDNDNNIDSNRSFKVYGDQNWGITAFDNYSGSGGWESYTIDVGSYFTGTFSHLVFISDDDGGGIDGNTWFRNFKIYDTGNIDDASNTLNGGDGNDTLIAGSFGDIINGGEGDDTVTGDAGNDEIYGEAGDDNITGGLGVDQISGGDGSDTINGGDGDDVLYAGELNFTSLQDQISAIIASNPGVQYYDPDVNDSVLGSFYRLETTNLNWNAAQTNAQSMTINGVAGYLAVVTSQGENDFLRSLISGDSWLGGSDSAVEGEWRWVGGPENGQQFWQGNATGTSVGGLYENWNGGEPNNSGDEDAVEMNSSGGWNDQGAGATQDSLIEWSGADLLTIPIDDSGTVNTINGGNGNDQIYSAAGDDLLYGGAGNDTIEGSEGTDTLYGEGGDDTLSGGDDADILYGGDGNDILNGDLDSASTTKDQGWQFDYYDLATSPNSLATAGFTLNGGQNNVNASTSSGITQDLNPNNFDTGDNFALRFETTLTITTGGTYTFQTRSDDGSKLFLDGVEIVDNDGAHSARTRTSAGQTLAAGEYNLVATFFERGGGQVMEVTMSGPDTGSVYVDLASYADVGVISTSGFDDILYGGDGLDTLFGGFGADTFVFENASAFNDIDNIEQFNESEGDILDISDILSGLGVNALNVLNFVEITSTDVHVDTSGTGTFNAGNQIISFTGTTDVSDALTMFNDGNLIVS